MESGLASWVVRRGRHEHIQLREHQSMKMVERIFTFGEITPLRIILFKEKALQTITR